MTSRLNVGNLSINVSRGDLESVFAGAGVVRDITIPTDSETGQGRGFAFVVMESPQAAQTAIARLNGDMLDGRSIKISLAPERPARPRA